MRILLFISVRLSVRFCVRSFVCVFILLNLVFKNMNIFQLFTGHVVKVNIEKTFEKVELHPDLAVNLSPAEVKTGVFASTLTAELVVKDNKATLLPADISAWNPPPVITSSSSSASSTTAVTGAKKRKMKTEPQQQQQSSSSSSSDSSRSVSSSPPPPIRRPCPPPAKRVHGNLDLAAFVALLRQQGFKNPKVEEGAGGSGAIVEIDADTLITIEEGSTHIICEGQETMREKLRDILLECLPKF